LVENSPLFISAIIFLILANGFFVASEFALIRVRASRIRELIAQGSKRAKRVQQITKDLNRTTSSAQLGITLASIALGFIGEGFFSEVITEFFHWTGFEISATIVSIMGFLIGYFIITYMHVTLGELLPKIVSIQYTERVALICAEPLYWFMFFTAPLLNFFVGSANVVSRIFRIPVLDETHVQAYTEEELKIIIRESIPKGEIEEYESKLIFNVLEFTDKTAKDLLTPRIDIQALPITSTVNDIFNLSIETGFSRIPIYKEELDTILGFIHIKDTIPLIQFSSDQKSTFDITNILRQVILVHEGKPIDDLLKEMQNIKTQVAIIVDEYGSVEGLVTLEDIIEAIIGPIEDEFDPFDMKETIEVKDNVLTSGGLVTIESFNEILHDKFGTTIVSENSITLAGYVLELFESEIPEEGEEIHDNNFYYKIRQTSGNRIDTIEVREFS
jgi:CBS domain containing-hemolysin-like protein